jgi:Sap, sulfolipid-1-addressing protein
MNWVGYYGLALFAAVYPVLLAIVALFLTRPRPILLLSGLLTGAFLTTMIAGVVLVSVVGSTDALSGSNKATVRAWVNIAIGVILIAGTVYILLNQGERPLLHRKRSKAPDSTKTATTTSEPSGWSKRAGAADSFWAAAIIGVAIDLPSVWFLAALKYLIDAKFSVAVVFLLLLSYAVIAYLSIELSLLFSIKWPAQTQRVVQSANNWLKGHQRLIAAGIAGFIGIWQLSLGISKLP